MRIFKYKKFKKWAEEESISDQILLNAVEEMERGLFEANLGNGLYKKRIARQNQGKSSGYRVLLAFKQNNHFFFLHGFAKNKLTNIKENEKTIYRDLAKYLLSLETKAINQLIKMNELTEVLYESKTKINK